jgi:hypothetical protein
VADAPRLIRPVSAIRLSLVYGITPKKPLYPVHGSKIVVGTTEYKVWVDADSRAFAVNYGEDPNEH